MTVLLCATILPGVALAQSNLPWKNGSAPAAAPQPMGGAKPWQSAPQHGMGQPPMMQEGGMEAPETRELDDRKLNSLAKEYYAISTKSKTAVAKLTALQKRVKDFHKALDSRMYEVHDLVADVKKLEGRIAAAKKKAIAAQTPEQKADDVAKKAVEAVTKTQ